MKEVIVSEPFMDKAPESKVKLASIKPCLSAKEAIVSDSSSIVLDLIEAF